MSALCPLSRVAVPLLLSWLTVRPAAAAPPAEEKIRVAVMDLSASNLAPGLGATLTGIISEELEQLGAFKPISKQDIAQLLQYEKVKDLAGCTEVSCLAEIGGALGADLVLAGSVILLEDVYLVQLQLIRIADTKVESRLSREYRGDAIGLTRDVRVATGMLVRDILAGRSGRLVLVVTEEGATVKVDHAIVGVTPLDGPLTLAQGPHNLLVEKEGFVRFSKDVSIVKDDTTRLEARLRPSQEFLDAYAGTARRQRVLAWTFTSAGVLALGGGVAAYVVSDQKAARYRRDYARDPFAGHLDGLYGQIITLDTVAVVTGVLALGALATGVIAFLAGPDPDRYESALASPAQAAQPAPRWHLGFAGSTLSGRLEF